jgi:hypothetical protein
MDCHVITVCSEQASWLEDCNSNSAGSNWILEEFGDTEEKELVICDITAQLKF